MPELRSRFGYTDDRVNLLKGFSDYRAALHQIGLQKGIQILNGSFSEDIETIDSRSPRDIDLVTVLFRPPSVTSRQDWIEYLHENRALFDNEEIKKRYQCDAYFVDIEAGGSVIEQLFYWHGLFEHQRETFAWKGSLIVDLSPKLGRDAE